MALEEIARRGSCATAQGCGKSQPQDTLIASADPDVLAVAHAEGITTIALPGPG